MMWAHYVYIHYKNSDDTPFYVGKGTLRCLTRPIYDRANEKYRGLHWERIVKKHGLRIEIFASCKTDKAAQGLEKELVAEFGRLDIGTGRLINRTDGGDGGSAGRICSDELRKKRSINAKMKVRTPEWNAAISRGKKAGSKNGFIKPGSKLPAHWRASLSRCKKGELNPWYGKASPVAKKIINKRTGQVYRSIAEAARVEGIYRENRLYEHLSGAWHRPELDHLVKV